MNGTLAVLFLAAGLTDMGVNYCPDQGCLAPSTTDGFLGLSYGDVMFQDDTISHEAFVTYDAPMQYGPFQPKIGLSATGDGDVWGGIGAGWTTHFQNAYLQLYLMPGLYRQGDGPDLGTMLEFRSGIELGYQAHNGVRYGLSYDHRSNGDISETNPGLETFQFKVSFPFN